MITFNYKTFGDETKRRLLLLHGFLGSTDDYTEMAEYLSIDNFVVLLDLPGHGKTKCTDESDYKAENCSKQIISLLEEMNIEKTDLLGYSMGGRLALYLTVHHPNNFEKIIIESSSPGLKTEAEREERIKADRKLAERIEEKELSEFIDLWYSLPLFKTLDKKSERYKQMVQNRIKSSKDGLILSLKHFGTGAQPSLGENLSEIKQKLLLIVGEDDDKFKNIALEMQNQLADSELRIVKNAGHNVHFEKPDEYIKIVKEYLK